MTVKMKCMIEYADGAADQFDFLLLSWGGYGESMSFWDKSSELRINPNTVKNLRIEPTAE